METKGAKPTYDSIVLLEIPVSIRNDKGEEVSIWGILYNRQMAHEEDLWFRMLNAYICYVQASEILQNKGAELYQDCWKLKNGNIITLQIPYKNLIYRIMRDQMLRYKLVEPSHPLDLREEEIDGNFLISTAPLERMGIEYGVKKETASSKKIQHKGTNEKK